MVKSVSRLKYEIGRGYKSSSYHVLTCMSLETSLPSSLEFQGGVIFGPNLFDINS